MLPSFNKPAVEKAFSHMRIPAHYADIFELLFKSSPVSFRGDEGMCLVSDLVMLVSKDECVLSSSPEDAAFARMTCMCDSIISGESPNGSRSSFPILERVSRNKGSDFFHFKVSRGMLEMLYVIDAADREGGIIDDDIDD